jgi:hypothetical protein
MQRLTSILLSVAFVGCGDSGAASSGFGVNESGTTALVDASTGEPPAPVTTTTVTTGPETPTGSGDGTTRDLPDPTTTSPADSAPNTTLTTGPDACDRVDFLFVIDSSISMQPEQTALTAAFPAFIDTIKASVEAQDYHIMVVDTDEWGVCTEYQCNKGGNKNEACNKEVCTAEFDMCDRTLGAGVVHPAGAGSSNKKCELMGGNRYLLSEDPALTDNFACVATVGLAGHTDERPMDAAVAALQSDLNAPGGCNDGFLREDAILVITMITDDYEKADQLSASEAYDAVIAAKGGDLDRTVVLGLIPDPDACPGVPWSAGAHWAEFIDMFGPRGIKAPVCNADFNTFFQQAVAIIVDTCYINPG